MRFSKSQIDTFRKLLTCVVKASPGNHILAVPTYNPVRKIELVSWHNWEEFLKSSYKRIPNITKFHHFSFASKQRDIKCKEFADSSEEKFEFMLHEPTGELQHIKPPGLSRARKWYLYNGVRKLCSNPGKMKFFIPKPKRLLATKKRSGEKSTVSFAEPKTKETS